MALCSSIRADGGRCRAQAIGNSEWCFNHHPDYEEERRQRASKGGKRGGRGRPSVELARLQARFEELAEKVLAGEVERGVGAVAGQLLNSARACEGRTRSTRARGAHRAPGGSRGGIGAQPGEARRHAVGSIERRIQHLEDLWGMDDAPDGKARRQRAREKLAELERRLAVIAERANAEEAEGSSRRRHALEDLEEHMERSGTIRNLYREVFGVEIGDAEFEQREALRHKYGAVSLAPPSEQAKLRRFG